MEASRLKVDRIITSDRITGSSLQTRVDLAPHHVVWVIPEVTFLSFSYHIVTWGAILQDFFQAKTLWIFCVPTTRHRKRVHWNKLSLLWITPVFFLLRCHGLFCHVISNHRGKECKFPPSESPFWIAGLEHVSVTGRLLWEMFVSGFLFCAFGMTFNWYKMIPRGPSHFHKYRPEMGSETEREER